MIAMAGKFVKPQTIISLIKKLERADIDTKDDLAIVLNNNVPLCD